MLLVIELDCGLRHDLQKQTIIEEKNKIRFWKICIFRYYGFIEPTKISNCGLQIYILDMGLEGIVE